MQPIADYQINKLLKLFRNHLENHRQMADTGSGLLTDTLAFSAAAKRELIIRHISCAIIEKANQLQQPENHKDLAEMSEAQQTESAGQSSGRFQFMLIDEEGQKSIQTCLIGETFL